MFNAWSVAALATGAMIVLSSRITLQSLIDLCRVARHSLGAGIPLVEVFKQQAQKAAPQARPVAAQIHSCLEEGGSLEEALGPHQAVFPPLFLVMAAVGEQTGHLAEVFGELERYFLVQQRLRRQFLTQSIRPAIQFLAAVGIIAFLIWILGAIGDRQGVPPLDPLGIGLTGGRGAIVFLVLVFGSLALVSISGVLIARSGQKVGFARMLLRVPVVGPCWEALALTRFCLALRLTQDSGMPIGPALGLSLRATGNPAFADWVPQVQKQLETGQDLTLALAQTRRFPANFQNVLAVAEESGQLAEVMRRQAAHYQEEAERRLTALTRAAAFLMWLGMAVFISVAIIRIFVNVYLAGLNF
jgi:type IV pilus assembly protein PilC